MVARNTREEERIIQSAAAHVFPTPVLEIKLKI